MKKGDLSINIIIVAAIALIILVILSVLIFGTGSNIKKGTSCEGVGGQCATVDSCADLSYDGTETYVRHLTGQCPQDQTCCIRQ